MNRITITIMIAVMTAMGAGPAAAASDEDRGVRMTELTPAAEAAIEKGINWMARTQSADGSWGGNHKPAITALTLMAFMVKGYFPGRPPHGDKLAKGVNYLLEQARNGGGYIGSSMYEHGLATLALSEVWGMSDREDIRDTLKRAVDVILRAQNPQGGWRYGPVPQDADMSVTVMQIVALASAREAGIMVPDKVVEKALSYVKYCQEKTSGGFGYTGPSGPGFSRSAAGVMSLVMCGERDSEAVRSGLRYLMKLPRSIFDGGDSFYFYGHYYAVQAVYQAGEQFYNEWYPNIRDALLRKQAPDGNWPDPYNMGTPAAILILGVPYRFLPIYQR